MNTLSIIDAGEGKIQVSWHRGNDLPSYKGAIRFKDPLSAEDRKELRWYLEEYLSRPYGEADRAKNVEKRMEVWGRSLFEQVFVKQEEEPNPHTFYKDAISDGLDQCELSITSDDPAFLNIPWELMLDPTPGRGYLAPLLAGLYRNRGRGRKIDFKVGEPFRILLVISRPRGKRDIPLGTVARPILEAIRPFRPQVQLEVLRPPSFDALQQRLNDKPGYYHLVHFDGMGIFTGAPEMQDQELGQWGHLLFEKEDGKEHKVSSKELGQMLANCKVPLFVLNACQSAEEGIEDPFSSVASQLVAIGAKGVVAMSYLVYSGAASRFMGRFYQRLIAHDSLSKAVAEARRRLYTEPDRASAVGDLELRDWMVPALYQQEEHYVPIPEKKGPVEPDRHAEDRRHVLQHTLNKIGARRQPAEEVCPEGRFGYIGRHYDELTLERAIRNDKAPWVLLTGIGGIGKTQLAFGFARWYSETGGCPGGLFTASFKEKADFGQVIGSIVGHGTDFSRLPEQEQWQRLVEYLQENACLLVWDNFERVTGVPLATEEEQRKLARFLQALRGGKSRVLITSRKNEELWLGVAYTLIEIRGLPERDAGLLAWEILRTVGRDPRDFRDDLDYPRLIRLLRGHPRSLEVVLPQLQLRNCNSLELIEALQHRIDASGEAIEDASLTEVFAHLSSKTQKHLPFIGLFASYAHANTLGDLVGTGDGQHIYKKFVGDVLTADDWKEVLEEAGRNGLIRPSNQGAYELHPTLPIFLRRQLAAKVGKDGIHHLNTEYFKFYARWASQQLEDVNKPDEQSLTALTREEDNLLRALRLAEQNHKWALVQDIIQTIREFYEVRTRLYEWRALRGRLLDSIGRDIKLDADLNQVALWTFLLGEEANDALESNQMDVAENAYEKILGCLNALQDSKVEPEIAGAYHQFCRLATVWQHYDQAEQWCRKALDIYERLNNERDIATEYHELGNIALAQQQYSQAEQWYRKALEIRKRLALERYVAATYHQLGSIALELEDYKQAEKWYDKAHKIRYRLGLKRDEASTCHQLGRTALEQQQLKEAEQWHRKALQIREELGVERDAADEYHQLGRIALERDQLEQAEQWHSKALKIRNRLGLERDQATSYHRLGDVAQKKQQFDEAVQMYSKALEIYDRLDLDRDKAREYLALGNTVRKFSEFEQAEQLCSKALEIYDRLDLDRDKARGYYALGNIAQDRQQPDKAKDRYRKALEIFNRLGMKRDLKTVQESLQGIDSE